MNEYDALIIGSGAGGLTTALCLAKAGQKVLVLEQHDVPGGWCHSFYLNGHRFSPGVHYIGMLDKGSSTRELYESLGIANDLVFFRMNPNAYEHCLLGNERYDFPAGLEPLFESLAARFPHERKNLRKYLDLIRTVSRQLQLIPKMSGFWDTITIPFRTAQMGKYGLFSLKRVIDWHIKDPILKRVLNIQCGDHGMPPASAPFPLHCAVMDHYFDGGFYPMSGGSAIVKAMVKGIKSRGGEVRTQQRVTRILIEEGKKPKAVGVELAGGEKIYARSIVSNADPAKTFELVGTRHLSKRLLNKLAHTKYSVTSLMLFITLDFDVREAGLDSGNIWMLRNQDLDELYAGMLSPDILSENEFPALFISCPTLKDPVSFNGRYHNLEVVTYIDYKPFEKFESVDYHTKEYIAHKERITQKILNSLDKIIPGIRSKVVQMELGTPKTNEFYINATKGNVYGTEKSLRQIGPFGYNNKSEIDQLYLCGASTLSHGVAGASYSGVNAAARILKCRMDDLLTPDETQNLRVYDAENPESWPEWIHQKIAEKKRLFREITPIREVGT